MTAADDAAWLDLETGRAFYDALLDREPTHMWRAEDVVLLIAGETDLIRMTRPNSHGYAGPTQLGKAQLKALGWTGTSEEFCLAEPAVQIDFAGRYFQEWRVRLGLKRWESAGALWFCNLAPAHLKRPDGVVYSELEHGAQYRANRWLDLNGDKVIHVDELTQALLTKAVPRCRVRYDLAIRNLARVRAARGQWTEKDLTLHPDLRDPHLSEVNFGKDPEAA